MPPSPPERPYQVVDFAELPGTPCPCGTARRAFADSAAVPFTLHRTEISLDAALHYHERITETYYFLECDADARMQLEATCCRSARGWRSSFHRECGIVQWAG